jgi:hypothetical protein
MIAHRLSRLARIALILVWAVLGLFVLADLSEGARGDKSLMSAIPYDLAFGLGFTLLVVVLDIVNRRDHGLT